MNKIELEVGKEYTIGEWIGALHGEYNVLGSVVLDQDFEEPTGTFIKEGSGMLIGVGEEVYLTTPDERGRGRIKVLAHYGPERRDIVAKLLGK